MTPLEKEAWETLKEVSYYFNFPKVGKAVFYRLLGNIRDTIKHLENAYYGCPSGKHTDYCTCTKDKPGVTKHFERFRKGKR